MTDPGRDATDRHPPALLGDRYEVARVLGEGSFGRTLLCTDTQDGRRVAVKELRFEHLKDWKSLELFGREAEVLGRLDHPGIPEILDVVRDDDSPATRLVVQEFVEGTSLQDRLDSGPMLGQDELRSVVLGLLDVLDYLHGRVPPVLHRDIKPANILIRPDGGVALVDFGGVSLGWRPPGEDGGTVVGTFGYMPPEQLLGQPGPTSDLYGLGATLLHVVTGRPPMDFPFDSGRIEVPSGLPAEQGVVRLLEALLRPAPRDRPQSAAEARRILEGGQAPTPSPPTGLSTTPAPATLRPRQHPDSYRGPRFVDMGPPPRSADGEFADVWRNLVDPLLSASARWSIGGRLRATAAAIFGTLGTVGILPVVYAVYVARRRRRYGDLFREGAFTRGVILESTTRRADSSFTTFRFGFEVDGEGYRGMIDYSRDLGRHWGAGEVVPVLYDPDDPWRSCFVYR